MNGSDIPESSQRRKKENARWVWACREAVVYVGQRPLIIINTVVKEGWEGFLSRDQYPQKEENLYQSLELSGMRNREG